MVQNVGLLEKDFRQIGVFRNEVLGTVQGCVIDAKSKLYTAVKHSFSCTTAKNV